jgi:hypothetical protein
MTIRTSSKLSLVATCNALVTGLTTLVGADTVTSAGKTYTKAQLIEPLQQYVLLPPLTAAAKTAYTKAVADEAQAKAAVHLLIEDVVKPYLQSRLGKTSPDLAVYGLEPAKASRKSAATKAAAVQKGKATRKALGTRGTQQKKAAKEQLAAEATPPATPPVAAAPAKS